MLDIKVLVPLLTPRKAFEKLVSLTMDSWVVESHVTAFQPVGALRSNARFSGSAQTMANVGESTPVGNVTVQWSAEVLLTLEVESVEPFSTTVRDVEECSVITMVFVGA